MMMSSVIAQELATSAMPTPNDSFVTAGFIRSPMRTYSEIFRRIGAPNRSFIEFGVQTGIECNTVKLLVEGWSGLWIEASAPMSRKFETPLRHSSRIIAQASQKSGQQKHQFAVRRRRRDGRSIFSVDIDFNDWVWKAITEVSPRVVVIEYNATLRRQCRLSFHDQTKVGTAIYRREPGVARASGS